VAERAFEHLKNFGHLLNHFDQDALNAVLASDWRILDVAWQSNPRAANALGLKDESPKLYHFAGRFKPWEYLLRSPADQLFYETLDRTQWKGLRPKDSWKSRLLRLYDSPLRRPLHPIESRLLQRRRIRLRATS
jgi:lipopolysaccharide biosynthesis glycosyltransferase